MARQIYRFCENPREIISLVHQPRETLLKVWFEPSLYLTREYPYIEREKEIEKKIDALDEKLKSIEKKLESIEPIEYSLPSLPIDLIETFTERKLHEVVATHLFKPISFGITVSTLVAGFAVAITSPIFAIPIFILSIMFGMLYSKLRKVSLKI